MIAVVVALYSAVALLAAFACMAMLSVSADADRIARDVWATDLAGGVPVSAAGESLVPSAADADHSSG